MSLFNELKRRSVFRVAIGYVGVSWLVIQVIETLLGIFGFNEAIAQNAVIILAIGFVPTIIFAWLFELTPEGLKRDVDVDRRAPGKRKLDRLLDRIVIAVLGVAVLFFAVDRFYFDPIRDEQMVAKAIKGSYGTKSIAVLPFVNMSSDPEQEYFSDGISEELLNLLAQVQDLRVISRSSAFSFKGEEIEMSEIAHRLDVAHVLEGSVRKAGNRIRITAQLIEARTDTHLWSQTYDRELEDIFDIQDEVAGLVVAALKAELLGDMPTARRTDPLAHALTLQGWHIGRNGSSPEETARAITLLEEALLIDPTYIPAHFHLGTLLYWEASFATPFDPVAFEAISHRIDEHDERAFAVSPNDAKVLASIGWRNFEFDKDFQKAADSFEKAMRFGAGDEEVLRFASGFARRIGRFDLGLRLKKLAGERDPMCISCTNYWINYLEAGRYAEAIEARLEYTGDRVSVQSLVLASLLNGDPDGALDYIESGPLNSQNLHAMRAMALHDLGRNDEARRALDKQVEEWSDDAPESVAMAMAWMGDKDTAFALLRERYWPHMYGFHREVFNPVWASLHDDPRWTELREKSGYTEDAFAAIEFNPVLPD